jgi:subtilisin family serine protease
MLTRALVALGGMALLAQLAEAQIGLPGLRLPQLPAAILPAQVVPAPVSNLPPVATSLRRTMARELIRRSPALEADPRGEPMVRGRLVAVLGDEERARVLAQGYGLLSEQLLPGLELRLSVLAAPPGVSTRRALAQLRRLAPDAAADFDHLYLASAASPIPLAAATSDPSSAPGAQQGGAAISVGLIDGGVQASHPAFAYANISSWGCDGVRVGSPHGTAVASLLIGDGAGFRGAAFGARLYAADVYCGQITGGALETIAAALGWLDANHVPVVNFSLVGPDNVILKRLVQQMLAHGHLIVAAVGNDGPASPPLYPAAYPNVIGVTAVDAHGRLLPEDGRGPQVSFAAPGAEMLAAACSEGYASVRGTSFAAPLVAGLLAARLAVPDPAVARQAVEELERNARVPAGGDRDGYGHGVIEGPWHVAADIIPAGRTLAGGVELATPCVEENAPAARSPQ